MGRADSWPELAQGYHLDSRTNLITKMYELRNPKSIGLQVAELNFKSVSIHNLNVTRQM